MAARPISALLSFPGGSNALPAGSTALVTDTIGSPALFVLVFFLQSFLAEQRPTQTQPDGDARVVWVGCNGDGRNHLTSVARKAGVNLNQLHTKGRFFHLDAAREVLATNASDSNGLEVTYKAIQEIVEAEHKGRVLVIVDDLSSLMWSVEAPHTGSTLHGVDATARQVDIWLASIQKLVSRHDGALAVLQHQTSSLAFDESSTHLFNRLMRRADLWVEVKELSSGRARDCAGEISVHALASDNAAAQVRSPARAGIGKGVLYNLNNDGSVVFWARGTQAAA
ncbi:unnamed protein product [Parajaminaea phylloscopi]